MSLSWGDKWELLKLYRRRESVLEKLQSRKLWAMVAGAALLTLCGQLGIADTTCQHILALVQTYILGQAGVDLAGHIGAGIAAKKG